MSSLALMRWLEATPERYDAGMRLVTLGRVAALHELVAEWAVSAPGVEVLEVGCGTGAVTARLLTRGARVTAIDANPEMIEQCRQRIGSGSGATVLEQTAAEIDALPEAHYGAAVASLSLSEMSGSERAFVLATLRTRLRPDGVLVVADELRPRTPLARGVVAALRGPQAALAWLLAGSLSRPLADLPGELEAAGFELRAERRWLAGSLGVIAARPGPCA